MARRFVVMSRRGCTGAIGERVNIGPYPHVAQDQRGTRGSVMRIVDLFCGIGGVAEATRPPAIDPVDPCDLDRGLSARVVAAIDIDRRVGAVYATNHGMTPRHQTLESIPEVPEADLLVALASLPTVHAAGASFGRPGPTQPGVGAFDRAGRSRTTGLTRFGKRAPVRRFGSSPISCRGARACRLCDARGGLVPHAVGHPDASFPVLSGCPSRWLPDRGGADTATRPAVASLPGGSGLGG